MLRVVCAFDPDTGAELARLSSTVQPNVTQLSDDEMVEACRDEFVRLHSLSQTDADRARYDVHEEHEPPHGDSTTGAASTHTENPHAAS